MFIVHLPYKSIISYTNIQKLICSYNHLNTCLVLQANILMRLTWSVFTTNEETANSMHSTIEEVADIIPDRSLMSDQS